MTFQLNPERWSSSNFLKPVAFLTFSVSSHCDKQCVVKQSWYSAVKHNATPILMGILGGSVPICPGYSLNTADLTLSTCSMFLSPSLDQWPRKGMLSSKWLQRHKRKYPIMRTHLKSLLVPHPLACHWPNLVIWQNPNSKHIIHCLWGELPTGIAKEHIQRRVKKLRPIIKPARVRLP